MSTIVDIRGLKVKCSCKRPSSIIYLCIFNLVQCVFGVRLLMSVTVRMWLS